MQTKRELLIIVLGIIIGLTLPSIPAIANASSWKDAPLSVVLFMSFSIVFIVVVLFFLIRYVIREVRDINRKLEYKEEQKHQELLDAIRNINK